jgi:hypothetical protein
MFSWRSFTIKQADLQVNSPFSFQQAVEEEEHKVQAPEAHDHQMDQVVEEEEEDEDKQEVVLELSSLWRERLVAARHSMDVKRVRQVAETAEERVRAMEVELQDVFQVALKHFQEQQNDLGREAGEV